MLPALVKKELLALLRDRHGLAAMFLMPVMFIVVMSLALKDYYSPALSVLHYAVVQHDSGAGAREVLQQWQREHGAPRPLPVDWRERLRAGELKYVIEVEPTLTEDLAALSLPSRPALRLWAEPGIDGNLLNSLRAELLSIAGELKARSAMVDAGAPTPPATASIGALVAAQRLPGPNGTRPTAVQQNVPAWLVFGMFFIVSSLSNLLLQERSSGTLARLHGLGVPSGVLLLSKALPYLGVNLLQALLMLGVGVWLMPCLGGDALSLAGIHWPALVLALQALSLAAVSLSLVLACVVRTPGQAATVGPALNVVMAAIGGIMVPTFVMPVFMQRLAGLSPMNWGLEALLGVLLRGGGVAAIWPQVARLLVLGAGMLLLAILLFRRRT